MAKVRTGSIAAVLAAALLAVGAASAHDLAGGPDQHGPGEGHLLGAGAFGDLQFVGKAVLTSTPDLIADVGVDPRGNYAYLANWGEPDCAANAETGGINSPDAGVYVVDISDPASPRQVGFVPSSQDSRPGEGIQVVQITTKQFSGYVLVSNNEQCGKNGKGGVSLFDVTDPLRPSRLSEHFGDPGHADTNDIHSAFAWDAGERAYVVMTDNFEDTDVDILDITNPRRPRLVADIDMNAMSAAVGDPVVQPELGINESFLHDIVVKKIGADFIMLLSYWDGGYVLLNVDDPSHPTLIGDTDFTDPDPELLDATGAMLPPEGNAHQAEFTADNRFFIGTDEDFAPYRPRFTIDTGPAAGEYASGEFGWTVPIVTRPDKKVNGPTVYGGYGCPDDRATVPSAMATLPVVGSGEERILVLQRGPVDDPAHPHEACFFSEKVETAQLAGYDAVLIPNHHSGAQEGAAPDAAFCGGQGHQFSIVTSAVCTGHRVLHLLFNSPEAYDLPYLAGTEPAIGAVGERVTATAVFDGWGYVHLFDRATRQELDTYAVPEGHEEDKAFGFGDLTVHEVATHPTNWSQAYLSYYSAGMRSLEVVCSGPADCELVETGGYLDPHGNDFWGVETFVRDGVTYVLGSDRDSGLWIFRDTAP